MDNGFSIIEKPDIFLPSWSNALISLINSEFSGFGLIIIKTHHKKNYLILPGCVFST